MFTFVMAIYASVTIYLVIKDLREADKKNGGWWK